MQVVFSNAGKLNPLAYEESLLSNPHIKTALVIGNGRLKPALLLELHDGLPNTLEGIVHTMNSIWHTVEGANAVSPKHGVVSRSHILFTKSDKPVMRASKGTVQRKLTLELYQDDINRLYESLEEPRPEIAIEQSAVSTPNGTEVEKEKRLVIQQAGSSNGYAANGKV